MTATTWTQVSVNNRDDLLDVEDVYRKYASFSGNHGFEFTDLVSGFSAAKWNAIANLTLFGQTATLTATSAGTDQNLWYTDPMAHSFSFEFTYHKDAFGVLLRGNGNDTYYKITFLGGSYIDLYKYVGGVLLTEWHRQLDASEIVMAGRVKVSCSDQQYTSDNMGRMLYISIWINDVLVYSVADIQSSNPPLQFGLVILTSTLAGVVYSDLRIANLGETIAWSSLDPGEYPMAAIQRAIEDRYIKAWMRWNGKLKAYSPGSRSVSLTVSANHEFNYQINTDYHQGFSHIRLLGAFQWVQVVDTALSQEMGNRFQELNNTSLWNTDDCIRIATQMLLRSKEQIFQARLETVGMPYNEIEDRIKLPDPANPGGYIDYIIDSIQWDFANDSFKVNLNCRQYFYA